MVASALEGGLIPAHAGKTVSSPFWGVLGRAHPRSRGENDIWSLPDATAGGSSPLTRGKPHLSDAASRPHRLIPAHAGKTVMPRTSARRSTAHPRSRGENDDLFSLVIVDRGSSPLTRGKPPCSRDRPGDARLIPAHAGKTAGSQTRAGAWRAHPRSRGENTRCPRRSPQTRGSSPLTRGKPTGPPSARFCTGLIPAHAGKTIHPP